jgi:hypothetical protein
MKLLPCSSLRHSGHGVVIVALAMVAPTLLFATGRGFAPGKAGLAAAHAAVESHEVYRFDNTEVNRAEIRAALERLANEIDVLSARSDSFTEPALEQRLEALKERRDELKRELRKGSYDALMTDMQSEWRPLSQTN